jgi:hypothetical protein
LRSGAEKDKSAGIGRASPMNLHNLAAFILFAVVVFLTANVAVSRMSGWGRLARAYEFRSEFDGEKRRFQSAWMNFGMRYGNCLTFGANRQGLYLGTWPFALPGHPPLLIPWSEIQAQPWKSIWMRGTELRFRQAASVPVRIRPSLAAWLRQAAGDAWAEGKRMAS